MKLVLFQKIYKEKGGVSLKKICLLTWSIFFVYLFYLTWGFYNNTNYTASYGYGSKGQVVTEIQSRLKKWGYYTGSTDGVYGYKTYTAVKQFQRKNGLYPDGVAGSKTLAALGINIGTTRAQVTGSQNEYLLARLITGEARGEPYIGQVAIGGVVLNRTRDPRFPKTIPGIVYQPGAFTAVADGQINMPPSASCVRAARDALNGWDPSGGAVYYFNPKTATNKWIWSRPVIKIIGDHRFCR
jgi:N-acetylmuramoyl-L-alanine amidase